MDELVIDNLVYIPSKKAATITGYAKDYVGQLCREGRIEARLVGRSWYVLESSIREHRFGKTSVSEAREEVPSHKEEETTGRDLPVPQEPTHPEEPSAREVSLIETWESPTYTPEKVHEVFSDHPTYLTNTTHKTIDTPTSTDQIEEVQNAWQEWFSKNEKASQGHEKAEVEQDAGAHEDLPVEHVVEEVEREEPAVVEVQIHRTYPQSVRSMDMGEEGLEIKGSTKRVVQSRNAMDRSVRPRRVRKGGNVALKAVFVGLIIIIVAVTVIGTGSLSAINPSWAGNSSAIDFLAGVKSIEK